jgi:8-oxo-dGTP pyrophosphatase MutT (NUDIX family)
MITYEKDDFKFNFRVAAIIYNPNKTKVLLLKNPKSTFYALPGGRVEEFESSYDAIIREMKEEMNIEVEVKLTKFYESFFLLNNKRYHELTYYFLATKIDDTSLYEYEVAFKGTEEKDWFEWINLRDLQSIDLRPISMKKTIIDKDFVQEHVIVNEL